MEYTSARMQEGDVTDPVVRVCGIIITLYDLPEGRYVGPVVDYALSAYTQLWNISIPSCGTITALEPVSKFAGEPSALTSFVASCVVITTYQELSPRISLLHN